MGKHRKVNWVNFINFINDESSRNINKSFSKNEINNTIIKESLLNNKSLLNSDIIKEELK